MKLGDVAKKVVPKMCLVAAPKEGGHLSTRTFIPHDCHSAVGVLGAVTVATAAVMPGSVANRFARIPEGARKNFSVQHPTGEFTVTLTMAATINVLKKNENTECNMTSLRILLDVTLTSDTAVDVPNVSTRLVAGPYAA